MIKFGRWWRWTTHLSWGDGKDSSVNCRYIRSFWSLMALAHTRFRPLSYFVEASPLHITAQDTAQPIRLPIYRLACSALLCNILAAFLIYCLQGRTSFMESHGQVNPNGYVPSQRGGAILIHSTVANNSIWTNIRLLTRAVIIIIEVD